MKRCSGETSGKKEDRSSMLNKMKEAVGSLMEEEVYVQPKALHGRDLRETARLEGEWMKSLDKKQREAEQKKKKISVETEKREK